MEKQNNTTMHIIRGLDSAISEYSAIEQKYIIRIADELKKKGYPLDQLTRVILKNSIQNNHEYYTYNEITFMINPSIYPEGKFNSSYNNIGIGWEDPSVIRLPDGGIEFEVGRKVAYTDLEMFLYRVDDSYSHHPLLKDYDAIQERINEVLINNTIKEESINNRVNDWQNFATKGLVELTKNYFISIMAYSERKDVYKLNISRLEHKKIDTSYFHELIEDVTLDIDLNTSTKEIIDHYYPNFFPTPAAKPNDIFSE